MSPSHHQTQGQTQGHRHDASASPNDAALTQTVTRLARPLADDDDLTPLLELIGDARYVLLGEASHGTSEFYSWRARISQRLIREKGFTFVAVEGDWPECYRINRFVKGYPEAPERATQALRAFSRWPTWMWANWEVAAFIEWLRRYNAESARAKRVGFYGLDVYGLWASLHALMDYLKREDPEALALAERAYRCFEPYGEDAQAYASATAFVPRSCEQEVVALLLELRRKAQRYDGDPEAALDAAQNAEVIAGAERYYRTMVRGGAESWNVRDHHMMDTLERLVTYHRTLGAGEAKAIVWAHNTHVGDARATDMARVGMVNLGQLARLRHADEGVCLIGFGAYQGSVIAGKRWGAKMERMPVPEAAPGSWEAVLHQAAPRGVWLSAEMTAPILFEPRGHRAIGVVYDPMRERYGNYVPTVLPERYDAFLFFTDTHALHPLPVPPHEALEPPETYPFGV